VCAAHEYLNTAFLAAYDDTPVTMTHILSTIRSEFLKFNQLIRQRSECKALRSLVPTQVLAGMHGLIRWQQHGM
jgi:hypothetical protein